MTVGKVKIQTEGSILAYGQAEKDKSPLSHTAVSLAAVSTFIFMFFTKYTV